MISTLTFLRVCFSFFIAFGATLCLTPLVRYASIRAGAIDTPNERKIHKSPIANLGGIAIFLSFFATLWVVFPSISTPILGLFVCGSLLAILGVLDDLYSIKACYKLLFQLAIVGLATSFDIRITHLVTPFWGSFSLGIWQYPLTIFWITSLINTINLCDGVDGLATGIVCISAMTLGILGLLQGQSVLSCLAFGIAGTALGFLRYNFPPASIFMGDSGSMFFGFMLASLSILGVMKGTLGASIGIIALPLSLPILDLLYTILRRYRSAQSIFKADCHHFHHLLLAIGFQPPQVLKLLIACSGLGCLFAVLLGILSPVLQWGLATGLCLLIVVFFVWGVRYPYLLKKGLLSIRLGKFF